VFRLNKFWTSEVGIFKDYLELHKSREERERGLGRGCLPPQDRESGGISPNFFLNLEQFGAYGDKLAVFQFSTFMNKSS